MVELLDTTLRDGGLGLEDAHINGISEVCYDRQKIKKITDLFSKSGIDYIELGSIEISAEDKTRFGIYQNIESISQIMPSRKTGQKYAALFRGPDTPMENIPKWREGLCQYIRVIIRYSELVKSLDFCEGLVKKGYRVFVQPMLTMRYTEEELDLLIDRANRMNAHALYFVDSYGYMTSEDVLRFFKRFDKGLKPEIHIGFHAHNNMNLAFSNVIALLALKTERNIIVDSCLLGMGQGAGNLQTELIVPYLNGKFQKEYSYDAVLEAAEIIESFLDFQIWGYSLTRLLPALHRCAYKYAVVFRHKYHLSFVEINAILEKMPNDLKQRYTKESAEKLIKEANQR